MSEITPEKEALRAKSPLRLLQVEHEADDIELCLRELKKSGLHFEVDTVAARELYVQKLIEKPFDVVIADYRLPGWTGMDALAEIKQRDLNIPLILVTGTLGDRLAVECIKEGITDYVLKDQLARLSRRADSSARRKGVARRGNACHRCASRQRSSLSKFGPERNLRNALGHRRRESSRRKSGIRPHAGIRLRRRTSRHW